MPTQIALQMYTLRDYTKTKQDFISTLERVHHIGYEAVQLSAVGAMDGERPAVSPVEARRLLDENGIKCVATHRDWKSLAQNTSFEIDFHHALGCDFTAIGGLPSEYGSAGAEGYRRFVHDSAPVLARLKEAGIRFGYHNHAHEFERFGLPRQTLLDIFIEEGGADFTLEVDVFWAVHAGINPERLFERLKGRVVLIHAKDKEVTPKEGPVMAPVGEGNIDWHGVIASCKRAGVSWYAVEQDVCRRDPFDCVRSSYTFLRSQALS